MGVNFAVHNGKRFIPVNVTEDMVGHKLESFLLQELLMATQVIRKRNKYETTCKKDNEAYAIQRNMKVSPSKANAVLEMIRGKKASEALNLLKFSSRGVAKNISKF